MGIITFDMETVSSNPPAKLFNVMVNNAYNITPKAAVKSIEITEGDEGVGLSRQINFAEGTPVKYVKEKNIDAIDKENFTYTHTVVFGGDTSAGKSEKISQEAKVKPSLDGGSIVKASFKCHPVEGSEIKEENSKQKCLGLFKAVEAYLLANP